MAEEKIGAVTKLKLPRFVSIKAPEANARRGPGKNHKIDWTYKRRNLPLMVVAEHGHWRKIEDFEGKGGWIHYALLSRQRTVLITKNGLEMFSKPEGQSYMVAILAEGVVGKLGDCEAGLCEVRTTDPDGNDYEGWVDKSGLWGPID